MFPSTGQAVRHGDGSVWYSGMLLRQVPVLRTSLVPVVRRLEKWLPFLPGLNLVVVARTPEAPKEPQKTDENAESGEIEAETTGVST